MADHTPGPWMALTSQERDCFYVAEMKPDGNLLATVATKADACLMAAAPRMLDLLRQLARRIENSHLTTEPGRASLMTHLPQEYDEIMMTIEAAEGREG